MTSRKNTVLFFSRNAAALRWWGTAWITAAAVVLSLLLGGCAASKPYSLEPIKTFDPDNADIERPEEQEEVFLWDSFYHTVLRQIEEPLDLNRTFRWIGQGLGVAGPREADNVNALDEVPNSSWYTNRHFHHRMSPEALRRGPDVNAGPDTSRALTVIDAKVEGITPGFFVRDARGDVYLFKFDPKQAPENLSSSEVITTKIYHAAGYHVPQNTVVYFDPERLVIGEKAEVTDERGTRAITPEEVERMLDLTKHYPDGTVRALASKFVDGEPLGIWTFMGTRSDDPNDRVRHEHRRELRGLRVVASWLNDADRRPGNTMAVYTEEDGRRYVKHYLLDMGSTLGSGGTTLRDRKRGYEYRYDPRYMLRAYLTAGMYVKPWEREIDPEEKIYPSVGYFESEIFSPAGWVPNYPNPAFERATTRDGYWGAKLVTAFTDEDLEAIVETAQLTDPAAQAYLLDILKQRRDKIGRYWFSKVNPLDRFRIEREPLASLEGQSGAEPGYRLGFDDLAVAASLAEAGRYTYTIEHQGKTLVSPVALAGPAVPLTLPDGNSLAHFLERQGHRRDEERVFQVTLTARRDGDLSGAPVHVYLHYPSGAQTPRIAGIEREY